MLFASQKCVLVMNRMLKMKKYALSFLTMTMALSSGAAFAAAGDELRPGQLAEAQVIFSGASGLQHQLIALPGFEGNKSIAYNTVLAEGTVTLTSGETNRVALQWVNGEEITAGNFGLRELSGSEDPSNKLRVKINGYDHLQANNNTTTSSIDLFSAAGNRNVFTYRVATNAQQDVVADTYTMQIRAHMFTT
jgi:hypothetical protein